MQIIIPSHGNTLKILGKAKSSSGGYRLMTYVLEQKTEDGMLLFHTLTRELLLLNEEEYTDLYSLPELYEKWFIVPESLDDMEYADRVRFVRTTVQKKPEHIKNYTIFTTTDCNARCFYCYEMGRSRIPMSEETAHEAAKYIASHCGGEKVRLEWFGGEPLFNKAVISIICSDLAASGVTYTSGMISNGYLFDDETIQEAAGLWKLQRVQITLDGTEETYNRCKAFIYKEADSPYRIVMANIDRLMNAGITVIIRMNIGIHNADDLLALADELHTRFPDTERLNVYSHVLYEFSGSRELIREDMERKQLYWHQQVLRDRLQHYGLYKKAGINRQLPLCMCMADSGNARVILPGGALSLCEHCIEEDLVGHVAREETDEEIVRLFREVWPKEEACRICVCYPECIRLKKCSEQARCFTEMQHEKKRDIFDAMLYTYAMWKNRQEEQAEMRPELC